jgi:hypothetical protein
VGLSTDTSVARISTDPLATPSTDPLLVIPVSVVSLLSVSWVDAAKTTEEIEIKHTKVKDIKSKVFECGFSLFFNYFPLLHLS